MNLKHEVNRLSHLFTDGLENLHTATDDFTGKVKSTAMDTAKQARNSGRRILSAEEMIVGHMRGHSGLYIMGLLILLGALAAKLLLERDTETPEVPLL